MSNFERTMLCGAILSTGLAAQAGLERLNQTVRPPLLRVVALDSARSWATGSARTSRSTPTSSIDRRPRNTSTGPTRAASSPGFASGSGSTFRSRGQPAPHAGNLPPFRRVDQDRIADSRARRAARLGPVDRGHEIGLPAR